ncbi:DUF4292 domain-containing protein [Tenacibaculum sp. MEBiC06402]|uniref:DUF4292 domain-containing protein n=1 Tax=unclassified Tenacibaculum TaxID=2635139 RepID=UPI003B9D13FE
MKLYRYLLIGLLAFGSCKSSKNVANSKGTIEELSSRKIVRKHNNISFPETVDAKLKVNYKDAKENIGFSVKMKMVKDEVIWLKGSKIITVFKAKITPEKVSFYSPYKKNYFEGDFTMLKKLLGVDINFNQLQNMLLGQAIYNLKKNKQEVEITSNSYKLYPKDQGSLFDIFYHINPNHFKLEKQYVVNSLKNQRLDVAYPKYLKKGTFMFPEKIQIRAKEKNKFTNIDMNVRSIEFNKKLEMPFRIPSGYKEIEL